MAEDPAIRLKSALEIVDAECARRQKMLDGQKKDNPRSVLVGYLSESIQALGQFRNSLSTNTGAVDAVLNRRIFRPLQPQKAVDA
jgi:hypothetical protein